MTETRTKRISRSAAGPNSWESVHTRRRVSPAAGEPPPPGRGGAPQTQDQETGDAGVHRDESSETA